jgi:predicted alpha/beta-hydrolase family hydrolase
MTSAITLTIPIAGGTTTGMHYRASDPARDAVLVLAHGAGAGQRHPFMVAIAAGLAARGLDVVTFDFPYMAQKRKVPDRAPVLEACYARVIEAVTQLDAAHGRRVFIGGKSMGGRIATQLAAREPGPISGIVALGYPLHPPGKPEQLRVEHLPAITAPVLIVQGERDAFGTPAELEPAIRSMQTPVTLHRVAGGDHSLKVSGRKQPDVYEEVLDVVVRWVDGHGTERRTHRRAKR